MKTNRGHNEMEKTMQIFGKFESYAVIIDMKAKKRRNK